MYEIHLHCQVTVRIYSNRQKKRRSSKQIMTRPTPIKTEEARKLFASCCCCCCRRRRRRRRRCLRRRRRRRRRCCCFVACGFLTCDLFFCYKKSFLVLLSDQLFKQPCAITLQKSKFLYLQISTKY